MDAAAHTSDALYDVPVRDLSAARPAAAVPPCIVCGCARARERFAVELLPAPVVVCEGCGLGRFEPLPDARLVASFYPAAYYGGSRKFEPLVEWLVRLVGARHIGFLSLGLRPGGRVLDLGCGRGVILGPLADRGFEVHGVEISEDAARGADPRAEIRIAADLAQAGYAEASFDQVVLWHVLEHLPAPRETLDEVRRVLVPGGRLIVAVPNFASLQARWLGAAWFHLDLPRHLFHFPRAALLQLLDRAGFEVVSEHHFSLRQNPFGWIQSLQNKLPVLPRNGLYRLLQRRENEEPASFGPGLRALLYGLLVVLAPLGIALSVLEALMRAGGTVHVVARRRS